MEFISYLLIAIAALLALFILVIVIRALNFNPKQNITISNETFEFDKQKAVACLQKLITFKTISFKDKSLENSQEFENFENELPKLFPKVFEVCTFTKMPDRGLLLKWKGKTDGNPSVMMSHYDVVPVNEEAWEKPAFEGVLQDDVLWGRGTLDTKGTLNGILFTAEHLISQGFTPQNDIYFAFSGNEEIAENGAVNIVDYFEKEGITPAFVLDEGGAVVTDVFPGVKKSCGLIGIAEKGMMNVEYKAKSNGGHASAPIKNSPLNQLSKACLKVESKPFKAHITTPVQQMFDTLGRQSSFAYKIIFANLWCFKGVLDKLASNQGGELNALMRTTVAFTQSQGSNTANVIPPVATMVSNIRINPYDSMETVLQQLENTIDNKQIEITKLYGMNPSRVSVTDCDEYLKVANCVASTWQGCIVSPYLMVACSDSRHYGRISDKVYRFSAMDLTKEERNSIHGHNEKIRLETLYKTIEFYIRLFNQC